MTIYTRTMSIITVVANKTKTLQTTSKILNEKSVLNTRNYDVHRRKFFLL